MISNRYLENEEQLETLVIEKRIDHKARGWGEWYCQKEKHTEITYLCKETI